MGRALEQLAPERGWDVVARIGADANRDGRDHAFDARTAPTSPSSSPRRTRPPANIRAAVAARCPIVVGTTGWYGELPRARRVGRAAARRAAHGAELLARRQRLRAGRRARGATPARRGRIRRAPRRDASRGEEGCAVGHGDHARAMPPRAAWRRAIPITSVRTGSVPGHARVDLRRAVRADARWARRARPPRVRRRRARRRAAGSSAGTGVFTMRDVIRRTARRTRRMTS